MKYSFHLCLFIASIFQQKIVAQDIFIGNDITIIGTGSLYVSGNFVINSTSTYTNNGTVEIKGNITNDKASMPEGIGITTLSGTSSQTIGGLETFSVYDATINNTTAGSTDIFLSKNITIGNSATFTNGIIETGSNKVIFKSGSSHSSSSDASHVNGTIEKTGNQAFTFPIGDASKLRNASIAAPTLASDAFTAVYTHSSPTTGALGVGLNHISYLEKWNINPSVGTSNPLVTLSYLDSYSGGISQLADLRVANLVSGTWINLGGSGVGTVITGIITGTIASTTWGEFTIGSSSSSNPLPITLISFNVYYNHLQKGVDIIWETASEHDCEYFSIERSYNGTDWEEIYQLMAGMNKNTLSKYKEHDANANIGINYYRLREHDISGHCFYSEVKSIKITTDESAFVIYPNPFKDNTTLNYWVEHDQEFQLDITNIQGQTVISTTILLKEGDNIIPLNMEQLASGVYYITIQTLNSSESKSLKVLKQNLE